MKPKDRFFTSAQVRLIDADGEQVGIIDLKDAHSKAAEAGLDLVIVAESSKPPVCRIMDFGKLRYEQKKKLKDQKKHQHASKQKEIKFRVSIDTHDYDYKINHALEFLEKGYKLKITLMFRGREMAHKDIGFELIKRIIQSLEAHGVLEQEPKLMGRNISVTFTPRGHQHHAH